MKFFRHSNGFFTLLAGLGLVLGGLLTGCGGGSDGGGATQTGTVAVLLTDAPSDNFSEFKVTVNEVDLLSDNQPPVTIFSGLRQIDLLTLEEVEDLFMIHESVPAGTYNMIRLQVSSAEFTKTGELNSTNISLGVEGTIDLVPDNPITVSPGVAVAIRLDLDAEKSILFGQLLPDGFLFRPVVFVEILSELSTRLVRVSGEIEEINADTHSFLLRRTDPDFHDLSGDQSRPPVIRVVVSDSETHIFKADGQPGDFSSLEKGQKVHVRGLLSIAGGLHLDARLIEIGQFDRRRGTIESSVIGDHFGFCPDPCPDPADPNGIITVQMFPETLVLGQLASGERALIEGVMDSSGQFNAALILVKPDSLDLTRLIGIIQERNVQARTFNLTSIPHFPLPEIIPDPLPVLVREDALIVRIGRTKDNRLQIERILFDSLLNGDEAHVFGQFGESGSSFDAQEVITFSSQPIP